MNGHHALVLVVCKKSFNLVIILTGAFTSLRSDSIIYSFVYSSIFYIWISEENGARGFEKLEVCVLRVYVIHNYARLPMYMYSACMKVFSPEYS